MTAPTDTGRTPLPPWWEGTVVPTSSLRRKMVGFTQEKLQRLVKPTSGGRGRWIDVPLVHSEVSDDEY